MVSFYRLLFAAFLVSCLCLASCPGGAIFLGTGMVFDKHFGDSINFNFGKNINVGDTVFGLAGLNVDVDWGFDYDLAAMAGYPYGYGGVGSVTQGDVGYDLGVTVDAVQGTGFNGAAWGVPTAEQAIQTTHFGQRIGERAVIDDTQIALPFSGVYA